jgi:hypothetical protein
VLFIIGIARDRDPDVPVGDQDRQQHRGAGQLADSPDRR